MTISLEQLRTAVGRDAAIRRVQKLQPVGGPGDKIFPPTYPGERTNDALFKQWRYEDDTDGLRWDPIEDRRYAHQFGDPSEAKNQIGTVTGANRLAAIGFAAFTSVPQATGLVTLGISGRRGERDVCWPLPNVPTSGTGYVALLAHPALGADDGAWALAAYGVYGVARARRFQVGKYVNFERARILLL
jgi:hypothetical protein